MRYCISINNVHVHCVYLYETKELKNKKTLLQAAFQEQKYNSLKMEIFLNKQD